jgi:hypothetical protein
MTARARDRAENTRKMSVCAKFAESIRDAENIEPLVARIEFSYARLMRYGIASRFNQPPR